MRTLLLCLAALLLATIAQAAAPAVTEPDVLRMMDGVPPSKRAPETARYAWQGAGEARAVAHAIAAHAPDCREAARMVVWGVFESGLRSSAVGDGGKSVGVWQLQKKIVGDEVARDPMRAAGAWLAFARASRAACAASPPELRLAALAGGDCAHALEEVAKRERIAARISAEVCAPAGASGEAGSAAP